MTQRQRTVLLVGGSHDGERVSIDPAWRFYNVPMKMPVDCRAIWAEEGDVLPQKYQYTIETYREELFVAERTRFAMFVIEGMEVCDAVKALFNGYNPIVGTP
jgi:hypothetical protein